MDRFSIDNNKLDNVLSLLQDRYNAFLLHKEITLNDYVEYQDNERGALRFKSGLPKTLVDDIYSELGK